MGAAGRHMDHGSALARRQRVERRQGWSQGHDGRLYIGGKWKRVDATEALDISIINANANYFYLTAAFLRKIACKG